MGLNHRFADKVALALHCNEIKKELTHIVQSSLKNNDKVYANIIVDAVFG